MKLSLSIAPAPSSHSPRSLNGGVISWNRSTDVIFKFVYVVSDSNIRTGVYKRSHSLRGFLVINVDLTERIRMISRGQRSTPAYE